MKFKGFNPECEGCVYLEHCIIKYSAKLINICPCINCIVKGICNQQAKCILRLKVLPKAYSKVIVKENKLYKELLTLQEYILRK